MTFNYRGRLMVSLEEKIACLEKEVLRRKRDYPVKMARRRILAKTAYREIEIMSQIADDYRKQLAETDLFAPKEQTP